MFLSIRCLSRMQSSFSSISTRDSSICFLQSTLNWLTKTADTCDQVRLFLLIFYRVTFADSYDVPDVDPEVKDVVILFDLSLISSSLCFLILILASEVAPCGIVDNRVSHDFVVNLA